MRRRLARTGIGLLVVIIVVGSIAYSLGRRSLPQVDGTVTVSGISAPVDIVRDADAVPHIFASTRHDALFGLGYVHAQDRLWQMEFQRRVGDGRLSEIFGRSTIPQDRFLRTVGFGRAARTAWSTLPDEARRAIEAYVAGVNQFIAAYHGTALPPEFTLLRFEPEPWSGPDVLAWAKMMAWDLSGNYSFELLRHDLTAAVGARRMAELMPPYPSDGLSILAATSFTPTARRETPAFDEPFHSRTNARAAELPTAYWLPAVEQALSSGESAVSDVLLGAAATEALGSNNWVVDGTMTASGKPLLANDPHLGTRLPSTWYLAQMSAGDFEVIGATLPGTPAVALGRNRSIAWGATNVAADVEDLYRERLDATGRFAEFDGRQEPLEVVHETIGVKGNKPVQLDVRISRHGPLVSDAINAASAELPRGAKPARLEPLALRWTGLDADDTTILAFLRLNAARNWTDFADALKLLVVPSQNFVYADVDGHIGYYAPGRIPIRANGDGSAPVDGASGAFEWNGWIPFDELPHAFDPPDHLVVTANDRPAAAGYPYLLGLEWPEPYRAERIGALLRQPHVLTPDVFRTIQADTMSLNAKTLIPLLLPRAHPRDSLDSDALGLLRRWDGDARGDSAAAAVFEAWFLRLAPAIAGDELGPLLRNYEGRYSFVTRFVVRTLSADPDNWCDDVRTAARESCDETVSAALHEAVRQLARDMGGDVSRWRWDRVHRAMFPHQGFDGVGVLRPFFSRSIPNGGDWSTVDVGAVASDQPFDQRSVPGYRQIIDLSPHNDSWFLNDLGQSGHVLSPHYDDFLADWRAVKERPMRMDRGAILEGGAHVLTLSPPRL